jgi:hypothetical protein
LFKKLFLPTIFVIVAAVPVTSAQAEYGDLSPEVAQTLTLEPHFGIVDNVLKSQTFSRGSYEIVTTEPWRKPEIANQMLSDTELISILRQVGFRGNGLQMAWAVVQKESTSRPYAHNDNPNTGDNSYGLFQINMFKGLEASRQKAYGITSNEELFDPILNAEIAYKISRGGASWGAWTTAETARSMISQFPNK